MLDFANDDVVGAFQRRGVPQKSVQETGPIESQTDARNADLSGIALWRRKWKLSGTYGEENG